MISMNLSNLFVGLYSMIGLLVGIYISKQKTRYLAHAAGYLISSITLWPVYLYFLQRSGDEEW